MNPLPFVLEQTPYYLMLALPIGGSIIGIVSWEMVKAWRGRWGQITPGVGLAYLALLALGAYPLIQPIGWQLRFDRDGIHLSAPFDVFATHGSIAWDDFKGIGFGASYGRGGTAYPTVEFLSRSGADLTLKSLSGLPGNFWPVLVAAVHSGAPGYEFRPGDEAWIAAAREHAQRPDWSITGTRYVLRSGATP